ncbi:MAG: hypothetical protein OEU74_00080 [Gammaproteobacteria bacterium]|nr:hypothetical protein [Gammaproteobacteria bacterium]
MMTFAGVAILVAGFVVLVKIFGLVEKSTEVFSVSRLALSDIQNPDLDDEAKEAAIQKHAKRLIGLFFLLTIGGAAALALPAGLLFLLERMGLLSLSAVIAVTLSWEFLLASSVLIIAIILLAKNR